MRLKALLGSAVVCVAGVTGMTVTPPVKAAVKPEHHKLCQEAKDYVGCVKAMNGDTAITIRQVNSQGADITEGNQCPSGHAYIGGGNCKPVGCQWGQGASLGHSQLVAGLKDNKGKDVWGCKTSFWYGRGVMRLGDSVVRTTTNSECPAGEPKLGYNSTCQTAATESNADWMSADNEDWMSASDEDLGEGYTFNEE